MNRYCGTLLSTAVDGDLASDLVCDCTAPFAVDIFTDALADNGDPEDPENTRFSRGGCRCRNLVWQKRVFNVCVPFLLQVSAWTTPRFPADDVRLIKY